MMNFASFCPINEKGLDADLLAVVTLAKLDIMRGIRMISAAVDPSNILLFQRYGSGNIMQPAYEQKVFLGLVWPFPNYRR